MTTAKNDQPETTATPSLITQLIQAQKAVKAVAKDAKNAHFKSQYATISATIEAVKEAYLSAGVLIHQEPQECEDGAKIATTFYNEHGECLSGGVVHVPVTKLDAQGYGSAMTYARRYGLLAACLLATEDDDGNAAAKAPPQRSTSVASDALDGVVFTDEERDMIADYTTQLIDVMPSKDSIDQSGLLRLGLELMPMGNVAIAVGRELASWQRTALRKVVHEYKNAQKDAA